MAPAPYQETYSPPGPLALSPQQRAVLRLLYDHEGRRCRTAQRVGRLLGCSENRIARVHQKAVTRLRALQRATRAGQPLASKQMTDWEQFQAVIEP